MVARGVLGGEHTRAHVAIAVHMCAATTNHIHRGNAKPKALPFSSPVASAYCRATSWVTDRVVGSAFTPSRRPPLPLLDWCSDKLQFRVFPTVDAVKAVVGHVGNNPSLEPLALNLLCQ